MNDSAVDGDAPALSIRKIDRNTFTLQEQGREYPAILENNPLTLIMGWKFVYLKESDTLLDSGGKKLKRFDDKASQAYAKRLEEEAERKAVAERLAREAELLAREKAEFNKWFDNYVNDISSKVSNTLNPPIRTCVGNNGFSPIRGDYVRSHPPYDGKISVEILVNSDELKRVDRGYFKSAEDKALISSTRSREVEKINNCVMEALSLFKSAENIDLLQSEVVSYT
ncbi:MAG: hypothetical protein ORN21_07050 [Methylophilaceae bacterium]|nr:hypothetical protein [Methylophilaceae bacterium]